MSPLLTTYANGSARGYGAFSVAAAAGDFESIATVTVGSGGSSTVEFTSIPSTYTHLQIRGTMLSDTVTNPEFYFNNDTANDNGHHLWGDGSSANSNSQGSLMLFSYFVGTTYPAVFVQDILDYANTNKYKTTRTFTGQDNNGSGEVAIWSGLWRSTSAITSIKYANRDGGLFKQYSHFALYGIKSA